MDTVNEPTVSELAWIFLADVRPDVADSTYQELQQVTRRFVEAFGLRLPATLRPSDVKAWILANPRWKKPTTRWGVLNKIKQLFNWAMKDGRIAYSPIRGLKIPMGNPRRPVTEEEYQVMLRHTPALFRRILVFLRHTGCRPGEVRSLRWEWVDLQTGIIRIPPEHHKTGKQTRKPKTIALSLPAHKLLLWLRRRRRPILHSYVFVSTRGYQFTRVAFAKRLEWLREKSGLPLEVCLHGLRHLFGTMAIRRGASLKMVSKALGHASSAITEKFYCNLDDEIEGMREVANLAANSPPQTIRPVEAAPVRTVVRRPAITSKGAAI